MKKIPTAKEFIQNYIEENNEDSNLDIEDALIEFAKLHVEAALKEASDNVDYETDGQEHITDVWIDKDSILNSYSLDNIK